MSAAWSQVPPAPAASGPALKASPALQPPPTGEQARREAPLYLRADTLSGQPAVSVQAEGAVELRHAGIVMRADQLRYDRAEDLAVAQGRVHISFNGSVVNAPRAQLEVQRFEGYAIEPDYHLALTGGGGHAERIDILDPSRSRVTRGTYTTCQRDDGREPDWIITADRLDIDLETGVGVAEGAELRFFGATILALPRLSFPLTDQRKSGWLPPNIDLTTGSGLEVAVPYYWNIAPNRDATVAPAVSTRRGFSLNGEFRYLEPDFAGAATLDLLPYDRVAERTRWWLTFNHEGSLPADALYSLSAERVSDDAWWTDFPRRHLALTPRLLPLTAQVEREFSVADTNMQVYLRTQRWQLLQDPNVMDAPFDRAVQLGLRSAGGLPGGLQYALETEANRFTLPQDPGYLPPETPPGNGSRLHAQGWLSRPWREPGWWVAPSLLFNAASYYTDQPMPNGSTTGSRLIPTFSVGSGAEFERRTEWFSRALRQTLEPRLLYVYTPYVSQSNYPNFDSALKDYSFASIYSENAFSGIDRVNDTNSLTAGVTTRVLDAASGAELMQLGIVQRYLFTDQRLTDDGLVLGKGYSDVLLRGSASVVPSWNFDAYLRYSPSNNDFERAILGARYAPAPFRTLNLTYRYARDVTSQYELSWQWPIYEPAGRRNASSTTTTSSDATCSSAWYTVGRINYNNRDSRVTDSVIGVEYDAGCWIARLAVSRWSTGVSEANTQVLLQLELVGLSRLGSNAMSILRDNIPGYRLLREGRSASPGTAFYD